MVRAADVTADDLVNSVLDNISSGSGSASASASGSASASASGSSPSGSGSSPSASSSSSSSADDVGASTSAPAMTTSAPAPRPTETTTSSSAGSASASGGSGAAAGVGLAAAALVMAICVLLYLRRRRRLRASRSRRERFGNVDELGPAQPSIELPAPKRPLYRPSQDPGARGSSIYSAGSSAREGTAASVFHTAGAPSPTGRKLGASGCAFRPSSLSSAGSVETADGAVLAVGGRKLARVVSGREMDADDDESPSARDGGGAQYAQLRSTSAATTNAPGLGADGAGGAGGAGGADGAGARDDEQAERALLAGRNKRSGSVYDSIPALAGEQMHAEPAPAPAPTTPAAPRSATTPTATGPARRAPPPPPPPGPPVVPLGSFVSALPISSRPMAADGSDMASDRASAASSTSSTSSASTRAGSLIALNETTRENGHEIAI